MRNTNDGTNKEPYLRIDINYLGCSELPGFSDGPLGDDREKHQRIKDAGFAGIQDGDPQLCRDLGLHLTAHARVNAVGELDELVPKWKEGGYDCASIHLGWGMESDHEVDKLLRYVFEKSQAFDFPIYIETHRATITQDMWRTVELTKRFPEIAFNGDFSHWYTGQEMVYGGIENKWEFIQPVFDRVKFMHGRIGNPGCIQVDVADGKDQEYVAHFKEMWTRSFLGFLKTARPGDYIIFNPELLPATFYYARNIKTENGVQEEGDRWQQSLLYKQLAEECWEEAQKRFKS